MQAQFSFDKIRQLLRRIALTLAIIPTEDLEEFVNWNAQSTTYWQSAGRILNPEEYHIAHDSGRLEHNENELDIARMFWGTRKAIDRRDQYLEKMNDKLPSDNLDDNEEEIT